MKILAPVDGSPFSELATTFIASRVPVMPQLPEVELIHVQAPLPRAASRAITPHERASIHTDEAARVLDPATRALASDGLEVRTRSEIGVPALRIAERAEKIGADLIIMGSHGRTALKELVLGSVAQAVVAQAKTPVLILRGKPPRAGINLRVGVAVDGGKASRAALAEILAHDLLLGSLGALTLILVQPPAQVFLDPLLGVAVPSASGPDPAVAEKILAPLRKMAARAGFEAKEVMLTGWPEDALADYAKKHLDVIALGSTGRSRISRLFLGSVAARVAARCNVPLLLVRG